MRRRRWRSEMDPHPRGLRDVQDRRGEAQYTLRFLEELGETYEQELEELANPEIE
jgi:hypothetical protein